MIKNYLLSLIFVTTFLSGCSVNPVTGKKELSLVSEAQELQIGAQQYAPLRQSQGGDYAVDVALTQYVNEVGQKLAAVSDRKLPYEFKVLNNSIPNAWALPGGKISINRGLLTELGSESELAAVLGHEITHAAAKHGVRSMSRGMLLQGAMMATVIASQGKDYAQLAQLGAGIGAQLITTKYGRDAERESDYYGMRYMSRAGYDLQGAVDLQKTFVKLSEGKKPDWLSGLFASHPPSQERVQNNIETAKQFPGNGERGIARFQKMMAHLQKTKPAYEAYDKGRIALADGKPEQARALIKKAMSIEPREGHFYALLGDIDLKTKKLKGAKNSYDKAISFNDQFFYYYLQRGQIHEQLNHNAKARKDLEQSIKLLPTANAYHSLGNIAQQEGRTEEAKSYYAKAAPEKSDIGQKAFNSLLELDLADNPKNYISARATTNRNGRVFAQISNPTPRDVRGVLIAVQFRDEKGRTRQTTQLLHGTLRSGSSKTIDLGFNVVDAVQLRTVRTTIIRAQLK